MKKGIRYLRFSRNGQSNGSIEWQDLNTAPWFQRNNVELVDTFIDAGFSARTFDRPDMAKLTAFIVKHYRTVDYLVVDNMDRFSRDAGEALILVKGLQKKYSIQIVSVSEGIIFDYYETGNFFRLLNDLHGGVVERRAANSHGARAEGPRDLDGHRCLREIDREVRDLRHGDCLQLAFAKGAEDFIAPLLRRRAREHWDIEGRG